MAGPQDDPPLLSQLRAATTPAEQLLALRQLKNDIVGHARKKETVIHEGGVELLSNLTKLKRGHGKKRSTDAEWAVSGSIPSVAESMETDDQIRLQAIFVISRLANEGKSFIAPLVAGGVLPNLLSALSATTPPKILTEALRTISIIVKELGEDLIGEYQEIRESVFEQIGTHALDAFSRIISQELTNQYSDTQFSMVLKILQGLCRERHKCQGSLISTGIFDLLASKLAAWIVASQPEFKSPDYDSLYHVRPPPKSSYADLVRLIAMIVEEYHYYCARLFYSRDLVAIFPIVPRFSTAPISSLSEPISGLPWRSWESYLPKITPAPFRTDYDSRTFPALTHEAARLPFVDPGATTFGSNKNLEYATSDLLAWLATMARHCNGYDRICTLYLFANLLRWTDLNVRYERPLAFLVIPILVRLIEDEHSYEPNSPQLSHEILPESILATLVRGSAALQIAAYEADAIKTLCLSLRKLSDPIKDPTPKMWSPNSNSSNLKYSMKDSCLLGPPVMSQKLAEILYRRSAVMSALSSLTQEEDVTRKEIIKNGIIQLTVDALTPYPERMVSENAWTIVENVDPKEGNPNCILIANLGILRSLSKSIHILRTSLIDGGIAKPVFTLLRHKSLEVRIAATAVSANLILDFSPMKDELLKSGIIRALAEHARSADQSLRISALWALKHLVMRAPYHICKEVFEELGSGFIFQLITGDTLSATRARHLAAPNAYGQRVDLLNDEDTNMDLDNEHQDQSDDGDLHRSALNLPKKIVSDRYGPSKAYSQTLQALYSAQENPNVLNRTNEIRIQHHALDLLSNMIGDPTAQLPNHIDLVFDQMGTSRLLEDVVNKLKPRPGWNISGKSGRGYDSQRVPPEYNAVMDTYLDPEAFQHPDVVLSALTLLVHIANGNLAQKQIVVSSQPDVVQHVMTLSSHSNPSIRTMTMWFWINLLWVDGADEFPSTRARALEFRRQGVEDKIRRVLEDEMLDTKERAKTALEQFAHLLDGDGMNGRGRRGP